MVFLDGTLESSRSKFGGSSLGKKFQTVTSFLRTLMVNVTYWPGSGSTFLAGLGSDRPCGLLQQGRGRDIKSLSVMSWLASYLTTHLLPELQAAYVSV